MHFGGEAAMQDVLSIVLGGGQGLRLYPLTKVRSEPAVPVAGKYRLIDIPISNCLNSELNRIYVLTQYLSVSLHSHIANTYKFDPFSQGFVEVLAAQQTNEAADWYGGTADAVRQHLRYVHEDPGTDVLILSGDQLYRMDFRKPLRVHRDSKADITIGVVPVTAEQARRLGIVRIDANGRIMELVEKPQTREQLERLRTPDSEGEGREYLANMGIYFFRRDVLAEQLTAPPLAADFVHGIFPRCLATHRMIAYPFSGYWEDLGTIRSYHAANLALASDDPPFDFYSQEGPIYTHMRFLPASHVQAAFVEHCLISDGCTVGLGSQLERCVLGVRSRVGRDVTLRDTVVNGANRLESDAVRARNRANGIPDLGIGDGSVIANAILDKDCRVGRGVRLVNQRGVQNEEGGNYMIKDGILIIPKHAVIPDGTVI
jgi:glucose-1-phosphate adenylyltransferase